MIQTLSDLLDKQRHEIAQSSETLTLGALMAHLETQGIGALMVLFSLALALPSGIMPGLNTVFALPLVILSGQQALGRDKAWLPRRMREKILDREHTAALITTILPWLRRLEKLIKPRLPWATGEQGERICGLLSIIIALFASIPLPLTHTVPGFGLLLLSLGVTFRDGLAVIGGLVIGLGYIIGIILLLAFFGAHAADIAHQLKDHMHMS